MPETVNPGVPEQGQLIEVRPRRHTVAPAVESQLPANPLSTDGYPPQHLVMLRSMEDDALGEQLQVIWRLEPGVRICEEVALPAPKGFDSPHRLDAFLNVVVNTCSYSSLLELPLGTTAPTDGARLSAGVGLEVGVGMAVGMLEGISVFVGVIGVGVLVGVMITVRSMRGRCDST